MNVYLLSTPPTTAASPTPSCPACGSGNDARSTRLDPRLQREATASPLEQEAVCGGSTRADQRGLHRPGDARLDPRQHQPALAAQQAHLLQPPAAVPVQAHAAAAERGSGRQLRTG